MNKKACSSSFVLLSLEMCAYFSSLLRERLTWKGDYPLFKLFPTTLSLWGKAVLYPFDNKESQEFIILDHFAQNQGLHRSIFDYFTRCRKLVPIGRLAFTVEGGGKLRMFAIGNYVRQRLIKPLHDWAMKVLASIPNDGTYDQGAPL
ncbi:hypothetical protein AMTR_s05705p00005250, partial [Amborella trichopoda]